MYLYKRSECPANLSILVDGKPGETEVSETRRPMILKFGMKYQDKKLYKVYINPGIVYPYHWAKYMYIVYDIDIHLHCIVMRLNVPVNNFSVLSGRSQLFLGLTSTVGS